MKDDIKSFLQMFVFFAIIEALWIYSFTLPSDTKQDKALQAIVDEVKVDIENGDFFEAYMKANTIQYEWDGDFSGSMNEYDTTRSEIILQIREAEINNK